MTLVFYIICILFCVFAFVPTASCAYVTRSVERRETGLTATIELESAPVDSIKYGRDALSLTVNLEAFSLTGEFAPEYPVVRISIDTNDFTTFHVPNVVQEDALSPTPLDAYLNIETSQIGEPFAFRITRKSDNEVLFDTFAPEPKNPELEFVFEDVFLQFTNWLPKTMVDKQIRPSTYGLGPRRDPLLLPVNQTYTMWNKDNSGTPDHGPITSNHPFLLEIRPSGAGQGYFLLNSAPMDVDVWYDRFTWKPTGGMIDMFVFTGQTPMDVIRSYQHVVGLPVLPPRWLLGWHQCRWDGEYSKISYLQYVLWGYKQYKIPLENLFVDIDYMDGWRLFTFDEERYPSSEMAKIVAELHKEGQHFTPIVDPGVKIDPEGVYPTFDRLVESGAFLREPDGSPYVGNVWPGSLYFPDWTNPDVKEWWKNELATWMDSIGLEPNLWLDMNEPANFCDGYCVYPRTPTNPQEIKAASPYPIPDDPDNPPYLPGGSCLNAHTVPNEIQSQAAPLYYHHNLYAHEEMRVTKEVLSEIRPGIRPFMMTRASFSGTGHHASDWCGDNYATFHDLQTSFAHVIVSNMMGIISSGADIGGFIDSPTDELFVRWVEAGIWYPFSRDHSAEGTPYQEPWRFQDGADVTKRAVEFKLSVLPTLYSAFVMPSIKGGLAFSALAFEWPEDSNALSIEDQAMFGPFMIAPIMEEGKTKRSVYFPESVWYDAYTSQRVWSKGWFKVSSSLTSLAPVYIRGGSCTFTVEPEATVAKSWMKPMTIHVYPDEKGNAQSTLVLDDGVSDPLVASFVHVTLENYNKISTALDPSSQYRGNETFEYVILHGVDLADISGVKLDGTDILYGNWDITSDGSLRVKVNRSCTNPITIEWYDAATLIKRRMEEEQQN